MLFCSLTKVIAPKMFVDCIFVLINSVVLNLSCVRILFQNASSHSCFRLLLTWSAWQRCPRGRGHLQVMLVSSCMSWVPWAVRSSCTPHSHCTSQHVQLAHETGSGGQGLTDSSYLMPSHVGTDQTSSNHKQQIGHMSLHV